MAKKDLLTLAEEARNEAVDEALEARDNSLASVVRPAIGRKMTKDERLAVQRMFMDDPMAAAAEYDELTARFQLPQATGDPTQKVIPRRFVNRAKQAFKELAQQEREPPEIGGQ